MRAQSGLACGEGGWAPWTRPHLHPSGPPQLGGTAHLFRPCVRNGGRFCPPGDIWQRLETVVVVATRVGNACRCLAVEAKCSGCPPAHWTAPLWATEGRGYLPDQQDTARTGGCGQVPRQPRGRGWFGGGGPQLLEPSAGPPQRRRRGRLTLGSGSQGRGHG